MKTLRVLAAACLAAAAASAAVASGSFAFNEDRTCYGYASGQPCYTGPREHSFRYVYNNVRGGSVKYVCANSITAAGNPKAVRNPPYDGCAQNAITKVSCFNPEPLARAYGSFGRAGVRRELYTYASTDRVGGC